jgi:hypothetical protein
VVVERAHYELRRRRRTVDRHLRPVAHQEGQCPAVVQVRVRYYSRIQPVEFSEVRRQGSPAVGFDPRVDQHPRRPEVQQVAAAAHLPGPAQSPK